MTIQHLLYHLFYILLTVHRVMILGKRPTWRTILYHVFMFILNSLHVSSTSCSSSGETNCVNTASANCNLYRWPCRVQVGSELPTCKRHGHRHRVIVTRGCIDTVCLSWWWARCARNMYRVKYKNKYTIKNYASRCSFTKNLIYQPIIPRSLPGSWPQSPSKAVR